MSNARPADSMPPIPLDDPDWPKLLEHVTAYTETLNSQHSAAARQMIDDIFYRHGYDRNHNDFYLAELIGHVARTGMAQPTDTTRAAWASL